MIVEHIKRVVRDAGGNWHGSSGNIPAPGHSKYDRGISITIEPDRPHGILVNGFNIDPAEAYRHVLNLLGVEGPLTSSQRASLAGQARCYRQQNEAGTQKKAAWIARIWTASRPIDSTPAEAYLINRELHPPFTLSLRYHPAVDTFDRPTKTWHRPPAVVASIVNGPTGQRIGLHVTFLAQDGRKAEGLSAVRKIFGKLKGGGVWPDGNVNIIGIAEGIESALSANRIFDIPTVAALNAENLKSFAVPDGVGEVVLFADNEPSGKGKRCAIAGAKRLAGMGKRVQVIVPQFASHDANDMLVKVSP